MSAILREGGARFHLPLPGTACLDEGPQQHPDFSSHQLFDGGGVSELRTSAGSGLGAWTRPHLLPPFCLIEQTPLFKVHNHLQISGTDAIVIVFFLERFFARPRPSPGRTP